MNKLKMNNDLSFTEVWEPQKYEFRTRICFKMQLYRN